MEKEYLKIVKHYESCLQKYGDCHLGVDWPNYSDLQIRYKVMLDIIEYSGIKKQDKVELLDFGCGASGLFEFITKNNYRNINYSGLDISNDFYELSKKKYAKNKYYCLDILDFDKELPVFDFIILNGVFTEKRELSYEEMLTYFKQVIKKVSRYSLKGIAFNVMSKHVDWEREDLFHLPFDVLANFLNKEITRRFLFRNDYGLYEYTVYIFAPFK